jgi:hypothetical protein
MGVIRFTSIKAFIDWVDIGHYEYFALPSLPYTSYGTMLLMKQ